VESPFSRTELMFGKEAVEVLKHSRVAVFGIGGVGGYVVEALVRSGVGAIDLIDHDKVCLTNLNRQIIATTKTIGSYKVDVMKERILDINPKAEVHTHQCFYLPDTKDAFDFCQYSYVVDAVDTVAAKIQLVLEAQRAQVPIISSMGAGNKMHPEMFEVADIYETSVCPLARVMRRELKKRGIERLKVVYSKEKPVPPREESDEDCHAKEKKPCQDRKAIPGSNAFVPSVAGLILAGEVIKDLIFYQIGRKE
jgi:tRNA A37 threonylcarbamoyladenosine dehydratase